MTRLAMKHNAVNLSQGFPDFAAPEESKKPPARPSRHINQYAITWGAKPLRDAVVEKFARTQHVTYDPEREITVCCGSTEAMMSAMMAIINPGDEIVVFEPSTKITAPTRSSPAPRRAFVKCGHRPTKTQRGHLTKGNWPPPSVRTPRPSSSTRPTSHGKVFTRRNSNSSVISASRWNAFCITDEIYEAHSDEARRGAGEDRVGPYFS